MNAIESDPSPGLLATQWRQYSTVHRDRTNLLVHAATAPVFLAGSCALLASPFAATGAWRLAAAAAGLLAMMLAMAAQGRTHRREESAPAPFRGPGDVAARILAEQWITFPRYVLSGAFARAWRKPASPFVVKLSNHERSGSTRSSTAISQSAEAFRVPEADG